MTVQGLAPEKPTVLSWLKGAGYSTAALQTNVHMQAAVWLRPRAATTTTTRAGPAPPR
jgi:hypothetical protein